MSSDGKDVVWALILPIPHWKNTACGEGLAISLGLKAEAAALPQTSPHQHLLSFTADSSSAPPVRFLGLADLRDWTVTGVAVAAVAPQAHVASPCYLQDGAFWYVKGLFSRKGRDGKGETPAALVFLPSELVPWGSKPTGDAQAWPGRRERSGNTQPALSCTSGGLGVLCGTTNFFRQMKPNRKTESWMDLLGVSLLKIRKWSWRQSSIGKVFAAQHEGLSSAPKNPCLKKKKRSWELWGLLLSSVLGSREKLLPGTHCTASLSY